MRNSPYRSVSQEQLPLVSIVTPCLNRATLIGDAIESLGAQDYPHLEHIVADGGSTDGTLDILKRNEARLRWFSEPGLGQAAALNRALAECTGGIIGWLNSDDTYLPGAISQAVQILVSRPDLDLFYGDCDFIDIRGDLIRHQPSRPFDLHRLIRYDSSIFCIQSMFFRRRVYGRVGGFDESLRYALDYDWMIRVGQRCSVEYVPVSLGGFRRHEEATQGAGQRRAYFQEVVRVSARYGGSWYSPLKFRLTSTVPGMGALIDWLHPLRLRLVARGLLPAWL